MSIACKGSKKSAHSELYTQIRSKHLWYYYLRRNRYQRQNHSPLHSGLLQIWTKSLLGLGIYFTSGGSVNISCTVFLLRWTGGSCPLLQITHHPQEPKLSIHQSYCLKVAQKLVQHYDVKIINKIKLIWFTYSLTLVYAKESVWKRALLGSHHDAKPSYTRKTHSTNVKNELHHCGTFLFKSHFISGGQKPYRSGLQDYSFVMITSPWMHSFLKVKIVSISPSAGFVIFRSSWTLETTA